MSIFYIISIHFHPRDETKKLNINISNMTFIRPLTPQHSNIMEVKTYGVGELGTIFEPKLDPLVARFKLKKSSLRNFF